MLVPTCAVLLALCLVRTVAGCPLKTPADGELARYIYELVQNRQAECESGGDFLVQPAAINYKVSSFCEQVRISECPN